MSEQTFICEWHGTTVVTGSDGCEECLRFLEGPPRPDEMTGEEREQETRNWIEGSLTVRFTKMHERVEALVGRPVWTHEFAEPTGLYKEARTWRHPENLSAHAVESLSDIMGAQKVIVISEPS